MKRFLLIFLLLPTLGFSQVSSFMGRYDVSKVDSVNDSTWKLTGTFVDVTGSWTALDADTGDKIIQRGYNSTGKVVFDRYVVTGISSATAVNLDVFVKSDFVAGVQNMTGMPFTGSFPIATPTSDTSTLTYRASFYQNSIDPDYDAALDNLNIREVNSTNNDYDDTLHSHNERINQRVRSVTATSPVISSGGYTPNISLDTNKVVLFNDTLPAGKIATKDMLNDSAAAKTYGSGTTGYLPKWTNSKKLGDSPVYTDGTNVGIGLTNPSNQFTQKSTAALESGTLGSELLTSSGWTSDGWTGDFATGFTHMVDSTKSLTNTLSAVIGNLYQISFTVTGRTAGTFAITFGGQTSENYSASGAWWPKASTTGTLSIVPTAAFNGKIVLSIKINTGYSAIYAIINSAGNPAFEIRSSTNGLYNQFVGYQSGVYNTTGAYNTFNGMYSGRSNTMGYYNTFNGFQSGYSNTTGYQNTFNGMYSGYSNTTGYQNTFNGWASGYFNTTGYKNTFNGFQSGYSNTTGYYNTFNGFQSGYSNTTGYQNTFNGMYSGYSNTTGYQNTFNGMYSGYYNTTGYQNTFNGWASGLSNTTGYYNTFNGFASGYNASQKVDAVNSTALGANSWTTASNQMTYGDGNITQHIFRSGNVGIGTTSPGSTLGAAGNASIGANYAAQAAPTNGMIVEGNVGIKKNSADSALDVNGGIKGTNLLLTGKATINGTIKIAGGSPGAGKVLVSDADGLASWANNAGAVYKGELDGDNGTPIAGGSALIDGTGTIGWYYACADSGHYDYGNPSGNILYLAVGDQAYYNGTVWLRIPGAGSYTLPAATASTLGGIKVGTSLQINSDVLNINDKDMGDITTSGSGSTWTVEDDSHNHVIANVDLLQDTIDRHTDTLQAHNTRINLRALKATTISTTTPLSGGGDLSASRTLSIISDTLSAWYAKMNQWKNDSTNYLHKSDTNTKVASRYWVGQQGYITGNQTITLSGDVSGSGTTAITATVADDSHNHIISNVDALQDSLNDSWNKRDTGTVLLSRARATSTYEPKIASGTTGQYWRGDKTWQTFPTSWGISAITNLQDSLNDRYRRKDTADVLLSRLRAGHDYSVIGHNHSGVYDNYGHWHFSVNGNSTPIASGSTVDLCSGYGITVYEDGYVYKPTVMLDTTKAATQYDLTPGNTAYGWGNHAGLYPLLADSNKTSAGNYITRKYLSDNYVSFPGFGTSHSTAAYGDHDHSGAYLEGSGSINYIPRFNATKTLESARIYDNPANNYVQVDTALRIDGTLRIGNNYILSNTTGTAGQVLGLSSQLPGTYPQVVSFRTINHDGLPDYNDLKHFYQKSIDTINTSLSGLVKATSGKLSTITDNSSNWDAAYGWGNHANAGYITDGNTNWNNIYGFITGESDPIFSISPSFGITSGNISTWNALVSFPGFGTSHATAAYGDHNHNAQYDYYGFWEVRANNVDNSDYVSGGEDVSFNNGYGINVSRTSAQQIQFDADSAYLATQHDLTTLVPYTGATTDVNLGAHNLTAKEVAVTDSVTGPNFIITKEGGYAVKMIAGCSLERGDVVRMGWSNGTVTKTTSIADSVYENNAVGVAYNTASAGQSVWVVTSGKALVKFTLTYECEDAGVTCSWAKRGYLAAIGYRTCYDGETTYAIGGTGRAVSIKTGFGAQTIGIITETKDFGESAYVILSLNNNIGL